MNNRKLWRRASARLWRFWDWNTYPSGHNAGLSYFFHMEWLYATTEAHRPSQLTFFGDPDVVIKVDNG